MAESQTAFQLLLDIDQRCRSLAAGLPSQETRQQGWSGIGFRMGEHYYVAPMGEVGEILHEPRYAALPGVRAWVRGMATCAGACCRSWICVRSLVTSCHQCVKSVGYWWSSIRTCLPG